MKTDKTFSYRDMVRVVYIDRDGVEHSVTKKAEKNWNNDA